MAVRIDNRAECLPLGLRHFRMQLLLGGCHLTSISSSKPMTYAYASVAALSLSRIVRGNTGEKGECKNSVSEALPESELSGSP